MSEQASQAIADADALDERLNRIEKAITTMAWWLVQAQTGFGERDARGIEDILESASKQDGEDAHPNGERGD